MHVNSCNSEMLDSVHHISMKIVDGSIHACPTSHIELIITLPWPHWQIWPPAHLEFLILSDPVKLSSPRPLQPVVAEVAHGDSPLISSVPFVCPGHGSFCFVLYTTEFGWVEVLSFEPHQMSYNTAMSALECPEKLAWDGTGRLEGEPWWGEKKHQPKKKDIEIHGKHAERCLWRGIGSIGREGWSFWRTERCWFAWWCMVHCLWVDGRSRNWSPGDQTSGFARMLWASTQLWAAFERRDLNWKVHIYRSILWFLSLPIWISNSECVCALPMSDLQIAAT